MAYYRSGTQKPLEAGNGIDITDETISLKQMSTSQFGGAKIDGTSITVNSNGQIKRLKTQTVILSANTSEITAGSTDVIIATASAGGTLSVSSSDSSVATASVSNGEVTITGVGEGNCVITVTASATGDYGVGTAIIDTTVTVVSIYGAEWDGSSSPAWTRTDDAVGFSDPNPYYSGMSGTPSSPFDDIMPWGGMRIVEDSAAGTLVEIPKFYYKITQNGNSMKIQISMNQLNGFSCSPAHMDRGDGVGERDYIYIGRYHCSSNDYKSTTGVKPGGNNYRQYFRRDIHNLGSNIWQWDFTTHFTVWLLYLVEFANWDSQAKIGYGCSESNSSMNMGYTNSMKYHTGSTTYRTSYGGTQYRYIEGLWDNVYDYLDGCYYNSNGLNIILNPSNFTDDYSSSVGVAVGTCSTGFPSAFTLRNVNGTYPLFIPTTSGGSNTTYSCDTWYLTTNNQCVYTGGSYYTKNKEYGLFYIYWAASSQANAFLGSRLMVLPPSRLS